MLDSRLSTAVVDRRTQCVEHLGNVSPSTIQLDSQCVVDGAELLLDEHLAMTPPSDIPMREGSCDGTSGCLLCGGPRPSTRARYCTRACQQRSYRLRHLTPTTDLTSVRKALQRRKALVAHTIYECSGCGERFLGERRCGDCNVFARAVGVGGSCPECDAPVLLQDLLGEGVIPTT
jgi:NAD-dependent dihydropyrimidine dehydrogenase PreA subunit